MSRKHLSARIHGRVQGVGFRYAAQREAGKLGIAGFARNEDDGTVFMEAEGEEKDLQEFLIWCRKGPWLAKVEKVREEWGEDMAHFDTFEVR